MTFTTKATWLGDRYGCRVFKDGKFIIESSCEERSQIGPTFRDLMRTIDKGCSSVEGDAFTDASRHRDLKQACRLRELSEELT